MVLALVVLAEIVARTVLGLGDPPLWKEDPEIEYLQLPSRRYRRFGNRIEFNAWSMRSRDFPKHKEHPDELRVMVIGDSIVNGGVLVDQEDVATSRIERALNDELQRPVIVGNIGAHSWGPPNCLAYVKRFGLFDADLVVIVTNSPDYADAPTFRPLTRRQPKRRPWLALQEVLEKYVPRFLQQRFRPRAKPEDNPTDEAVAECRDALYELFRLAREAGAEVLLAQHLVRSELAGQPQVGHGAIGRIAADAGVATIQLGPAFAAEVARGGEPYLDGIHPSALGHRLIAETLLKPVRRDALLARQNATPNPAPERP